jgi:hypothetical protein
MKAIQRGLPFVFIAAVVAQANSQTSPVPMSGFDYGPGRIDSTFVKDYAGQTITVCGGVGLVNEKDHAIVVNDVLRVFVPPDLNLRNLTGQMVCVRGLVELHQEGGGSYAIMNISDSSQLEVLEHFRENRARDLNDAQRRRQEEWNRTHPVAPHRSDPYYRPQ